MDFDAEFGLFTCPNMPGGLRLTSASCAKNYQLGKKAANWETTGRCKGCSIGANFVGERAAPAPEPHICHACGAPSHRMVFNLICISCFNRLAEAIKGRNARGQMPRKWRPVQTGKAMAVVRGGLVFVGRGQVQLIARAPGILLGPQRSLIETSVIGRTVEMSYSHQPSMVRPLMHKPRRQPAQWPLFGESI